MHLTASAPPLTSVDNTIKSIPTSTIKPVTLPVLDYPVKTGSRLTTEALRNFSASVPQSMQTVTSQLSEDDIGGEDSSSVDGQSDHQDELLECEAFRLAKEGMFTFPMYIFTGLFISICFLIYS